MVERTSRAPAVHDSSVAESGTVTVACKLPNGLFLQLYTMEEFDEPLMGGGFRRSKKAARHGEPIKLHGNKVPFGVIPEYKIIGGYALTENVPAEFWKQWLEQNAGQDYVKNKLIFAYEKASMVEGQARELAGVRSGMEPINMERDPRMPKDIRIADKTNKDLAV